MARLIRLPLFRFQTSRCGNSLNLRADIWQTRLSATSMLRNTALTTMSTSAQRPSSDQLARIYAFRSITTFINAIEKSSRTERSFVFSDTKNTLSPQELQQLRINTALSVCAVRHFEVIAVLSSSEKTAAGISSSYIVTVNPKVPVNSMLPNDVLYYQTSEPDFEIPRLVSGKGDDLINPNDFIRICLSDIPQTFQDHFQTIIDVIKDEDEIPIKNRQITLAKYVIASSHRKMNERMDHSFSKPFLAGLLSIVVDLSTANYQHGLGPLKLTSRDMSFIKSIPQILSELSHDASQCEKKDCKFDCGYKLHLPELCRIAEMAKSSTEPPIFYSEVTFVEYHRLLVNLLTHFKHHLRALAKDARKGKDCCRRVDTIRLFGSTLHNMVSTKIMGRHMRNIEESLWQAMNKQKKEKAAKADAATKRGGEGCESGIGKLWSQLKPTKKTAVAEADDGGEGEGASAEMEGEEIDDSIASIRLQAIQVEHTSSRELDVVPISESVGLRCFQWLRLMTMYFEAMDQLLSSGLTSPRLPKNTTVQFVAVKHQGEKRMNWERCLTYLPESKTFPNGAELVAKFKEYLENDATLNTWFKSDGTFLEDNFRGTLHCEAIASVLMYLQRQCSTKLLPELDNLLGISKRCCPVCTFLIKHLEGFVIRGGHRSLPPCSLPPWLPEDVMQVMIEEFATRLRTALDNILFEEPQTKSQERASISSACLSVMSDLDNTAENSWGADLFSEE